jgi:hypothetical protein
VSGELTVEPALLVFATISQARPGGLVLVRIRDSSSRSRDRQSTDFYWRSCADEYQTPAEEWARGASRSNAGVTILIRYLPPDFRISRHLIGDSLFLTRFRAEKDFYRDVPLIALIGRKVGYKDIRRIGRPDTGLLISKAEGTIERDGSLPQQAATRWCGLRRSLP